MDLNWMDNLYSQVTKWAHQRGWSVSPFVTQEDLPGSNDYQDIPGLTIETPNGRIELEPVGVRSDGTSIVAMYAWPTLARVRLLKAPSGTDWEIVTDAGIPFHHRWNRSTFIRLAEDLLAV